MPVLKRRTSFRQPYNHNRNNVRFGTIPSDQPEDKDTRVPRSGRRPVPHFTCEHCLETTSMGWDCKCGERKHKSAENAHAEGLRKGAMWEKGIDPDENAKADRAKERERAREQEKKQKKVDEEKKQKKTDEEKTQKKADEEKKQKKVDEDKKQKKADEEKKQKKAEEKKAEEKKAEEKKAEEKKAEDEKTRANEARRPVEQPEFLNYYTFLNIDPKATKEQILKLTKKARIQAHPDRNPTATPEQKKEIEEKSKLVGQISDVLCNAGERLKYDDELAAWQAKQRAAAAPKPKPAVRKTTSQSFKKETPQKETPQREPRRTASQTFRETPVPPRAPPKAKTKEPRAQAKPQPAKEAPRAPKTTAAPRTDRPVPPKKEKAGDARHAEKPRTDKPRTERLPRDPLDTNYPRNPRPAQEPRPATHRPAERPVERPATTTPRRGTATVHPTQRARVVIVNANGGGSFEEELAGFYDPTYVQHVNADINADINAALHTARTARTARPVVANGLYDANCVVYQF